MNSNSKSLISFFIVSILALSFSSPGFGNCRTDAENIFQLRVPSRPGRLVVYRGEIDINLKGGGNPQDLKNRILEIFAKWFQKKHVLERGEALTPGPRGFENLENPENFDPNLRLGNFASLQILEPDQLVEKLGRDITFGFVFEEQDRNFPKIGEASWQVECLLYPTPTGGFRLSTTVTHLGKLGGPKTWPSGISRPGFIREFFNPASVFEARLANQNIVGSESITIRNLNDFELLWEQMINIEARTPIILVSLNYQNQKTPIEVTKQFLDSLEGVATVFIESAEFPLYKEFQKRGYQVTRSDLNGGIRIIVPQSRIVEGGINPNWFMTLSTVEMLTGSLGYTNFRRILVNLAMDAVVDSRP